MRLRWDAWRVRRRLLAHEAAKGKPSLRKGVVAGAGRTPTRPSTATASRLHPRTDPHLIDRENRR